MSDVERQIVGWRCPDCFTTYTSAGQCGNNEPLPCRAELEPVYGPNAQDVVDALRLVLTQDDAEMALVRELVECAPATDDARGVDLLLDLIRDGRARLVMT